MIRHKVIVAAAVAAIALTGCSQQAATPEETGLTEVTQIKFVGVPLAEFAPIWAAQEQGFFTEENLEVTIDPTAAASSAEAAALLVSGEYQLAMGSVATIAQGTTQGLDLVVVSGASVVGGKDDVSQQILSRADGPGDLKELAQPGNVIAVSAINSPTMVYVKNAIAQAGGDPNAPQYQAAPSPTIEELIMNGSVQGGALLNPFLAAAEANPDIQVIGSASGALPEGTPAVSVIASRPYVDANPEVFDAVRRAIQKGVDWVSDPENRDAVNELIVTYTGQDPEIVAGLTLPTYSTVLTTESVENLLKLFVKYDALDAVLAADEVVDPAALSE